MSLQLWINTAVRHTHAGSFNIHDHLASMWEVWRCSAPLDWTSRVYTFEEDSLGPCWKSQLLLNVQQTEVYFLLCLQLCLPSTAAADLYHVTVCLGYSDRMSKRLLFLPLEAALKSVNKQESQQYLVTVHRRASYGRMQLMIKRVVFNCKNWLWDIAALTQFKVTLKKLMFCQFITLIISIFSTIAFLTVMDAIRIQNENDHPVLLMYDSSA